MRVWFQCFTIGLLFMISPPTFGQDVRSHRVLFLGNSMFYYGGGLYQSFEGFCKADGIDYQAVSQLNEPANPHGVEFLNFGRIPLNLPEIAANDQIHSLIRSSRFDYVILEARRPGYLIPAWVERPESYGQHIPYEQNVAALGKIHRTIVESGAQTVLYMHTGFHTLPDLEHPVAQIYERLRTDLENMEINGERHNVTLVPGNLLWLDALNRYKLEDWYADRVHGTGLAQYASGCMLFTYLTGKDPRKNDFRELPRFWQISSQEPSDYVSEEDAKWIKDQVWFYYSTRPHAHHGEEGEESSLTMYAASGASQIGWEASGKGGAVAAGGKEAVAAGISILEQGGNAADAAAATLLALSITDYGSYAIGAEIPLIIYDARTEEVKVLCGLGGAPLDKNAIDWYYENGIPSNGSMKAAPVPGALSLCITTVKLYGTMSFEQVVTPSLELLDSGDKDWYENLAITFRKLIKTEKETPGSREEKLQAARDRFYKGDIADELVAFYIENGGFLRKIDLAAHVTRVENPVKVQYRGYTICKCDTWTQGPYLCQTLRLLEGFDLKKMGHLSSDYIHVLAEALKLGFADRDAYYGDPLFVDVPIKALLSDEYTKLRRPLIDMDKASTEVRPGDPVNMKAIKGGGTYRPGPGGTTTCVVADRWGNIVAATPSGNGPYAVCRELGVAHGNRLRSLNTTAGHPNRIEPGKRPRITLTPTIVLKDSKAVIAISVAGGDLQDQTTLNCLLNHLEFGLMPKDAVTVPRFSTGHQENSFNPNPDRKKTLGTLGSLTLDDGIDESIRRELAQRGHKVGTTSRPVAYPVMIYVDPNTGMIYAAGDPAARRHAAALENTSP